ncbi:General vesicular transport factor [Phytophthora citrophthora]|uniref:General vesicular transport factor n=1 Tax=Phytophthora citrophthora TaxID=4793 RepID=A0AAD9GF40_9STRA|nr:General vesicular transport factor [Phytophthora citrophthora]
MQALLGRIAVAPTEPAAISPSPSSSVSTPSASSTPLSPRASPANAQTTAKSVLPAVKADIALAVEALQFATLLGERKKAVNALQSLAQKFNAGPDDEPSVEEQELGQAAVPAVLAALVSDPRDTELMEAMLEFLQSIVSRSPSAALLLLEQPQQNASALTVAPWGMQTSLTLLQDSSPWIRGPAIALVRALQEAQPGAFAKAVLECKEGLRRLLEVVEDRREHIRDAALAVLGQLTGRDKNAQQFLAFEEGFARLFQIMEVEGLAVTGASPASSVIADCLQIVNNMLRDNLMTQTLFLEMPYLESHVPRILRLSGIDGGDEEEDSAALGRRKRVLKLGLQLVRFLVAGLYEGAKESTLDEMAQRDRTRKSQELSRIQSLVARQEALMGAVGELVCCRSDVLTDLRLQALDLLRLVSEHNGGAQMILVNLYATPSGRNVLADLMNLDVGNESDDSPVAAASSALLDTLFQENEGARMAVLQHIQTPPPPPMSADGGYDTASLPPSAGRVLLDAFIVNTDYIAQCCDNGDVETLNTKLVVAWKASHRLANLLADSSYCKELALRVPAEYGDSEARAVAGGLFLSRCIRLLRSFSEDNLTPAVQSIVFQAKLSVLLLLIRWCHGCPKAVREIVNSVTNLSVLVDSLGEKHATTSQRCLTEAAQLRGLIALLLGCCLEFLCEDEEEQALKIAGTAIASAEEEPGLQMTRDQFLQMISKRVGLEQFTDSLIQFQQTPAMLACARGSKTQSSRALLAYRATYDISEADEESKEEDEAHYLFMLYERAFTVFYREMAEQIQKRVIAIYTGVDETSTSVDSGAPNAMGAYQDLIRMQDKQIHDLQRKVRELSQVEANQGGTSDTRSVQEEMLMDQLEAQRKQFQQERAALESKIKTMSESALEMETRMNGLTMAYEQLEQEHQRGQESAAGANSMPSSIASEQLAALQAELEEEREANRRLRAEATAAKSGSASQALREKSDAELATARLMKQLEELRVESERKDEQLAESNQMLETLTNGQTLVKNDNEKLKAQLTEALLQSGGGETAETEFKSIIDGLRSAKENLERRVEELEAAARAAYEKDQEVLQQRIQEVELARRATPPVTPVKAAIESALPNNEAAHTEVNTEDQRLKELVSSQLEELKGLRALVVEMESVAKERETKVQQASFLQELVAGYDVQSRRDKEKYDATIRELEDELARAFLEKKDAGRKAKAAVKELENEVARLFLAKVELEKELGASHTENGSTHGSFRRSIESDNSSNSTVDDLLVLVASLEIQCSVLRDTLKESQGEDAVAVAIELSRQRGAVVSV